MKKSDREKLVQEMHEEAMAAASQFFSSEARLLNILQRMDAERAYRDLGHTSLMAYAVKGLKLSESTALNLINVARKAVQVPELKREIEAGELSVCMARKIVPVLTTENQSEWIEKAKNLTTRALEKEVAALRPQEATPERIRYVTHDRVSVTLGLDEATLQRLNRVRDLESQRQMRAVSLEETVAAMCAVYLEKRDPVAKAERAAKRAESRLGAEVKVGAETDVGAYAKPGDAHAEVDVRAKHSDVTRQVNARGASSVTGQVRRPVALHLGQRIPLPAALAHQVRLRDGAQCTHRDLTGHRCPQRRWLQVHHIYPVSLGGANELGNLATLCSAHHRMTHEAA
jgi:5-methylcytosine-specific restriction endonuclease McrA